MKAKNLSGKAPGGKRTKLAKVLPLDTPYVVQIFPIYACNFRCNYCIFQYPEEKRGFISDKTKMDYDLFKKCIDDMAKFPKKIKVLRFVGIGEPLLHWRIISMVEYAKEKRIADKIEIITNGYLLEPIMGAWLINAGLDRLVISVQGTSAKKYKEISGVDIAFEIVVDNVRGFYKNKRNTEVYIKVIDSALDGEKDKKKFYEIFGDICDSIAIEHKVPIHSCIDCSGDKTQFGMPAKRVKVCPQPFFHMQINPDGKVVPCYSFEYPTILGDANKESVVDIWNKNKFRQDLLNGKIEQCKKCDLIKYRLFPEDILDNDIERLKGEYRDIRSN